MNNQNKEQLRQMLDNIIDGNEEQAKVDFHQYMVSKVQDENPVNKQVNEQDERLIDLTENPSPEEIQTAWPDKLGYNGKQISEDETLGKIKSWVEKYWPNASHYGMSYFGYSPQKDRFYVIYDVDEDVDRRDDEQLPSSVITFSLNKFAGTPIGMSFSKKMPLGRAEKVVEAIKKEAPDLIEIVSF